MTSSAATTSARKTRIPNLNWDFKTRRPLTRNCFSKLQNRNYTNTMPTIPKNLLSPCSMKRVICHWSEGNYKANSTDIEHYHILIEGDGTVPGGDHTIDDNSNIADNDYAAHTLNANTESIGVACCCMVGCQESPFKPGSQPMKKSQWNTMVQVVAELCQFYGIPVTPKTVLGHGEVQANLIIAQKGKWDPMVWPWDTSKTRAQVGAALRKQVAAALAKLGRGASDSVSKSPAIAVSAPVASSTPFTTTLEVRPVAPLGRAKVQSPDGTLNVRSAPKASARKLRALKNEDVVDIFGVKGGWAAIAPSAKEWVARKFLEPVETVTPILEPTALPTPSVDHHVAYTLRSALFANDPTLRQIAETSLVLVPPQHPKPVSGIEAIQEAINRLATAGVTLPRINFGADDKYRGWFGGQTANALRAFQRFAEIGVDAKIGDDTLRALDNALVSAGVGGPMPGAPAGQPKPSLAAAKKPAAGAPTPDGKFVKTRVKVSNRGIPPVEFLQELVAWGKMAPEEIFVDEPGSKTDAYASVMTELGPFENITHRKACMLEVMRVLAGFESSWKWNTGRDTTNPDENTPDTISAGPFQVSANSLAFGQDLKDLVAPHGIRNAKRDGEAFQALMKTNHPLAMEYVARLMRHTMRHNGPLFKDRSKFTGELREKEQSIYPWLSRKAVAEFEAFLRPRRPIRRRTGRTSRRSGRSSGASAKRLSGSRT
jgi:hypothetical protein